MSISISKNNIILQPLWLGKIDWTKGLPISPEKYKVEQAKIFDYWGEFRSPVWDDMREYRKSYSNSYYSFDNNQYMQYNTNEYESENQFIIISKNKKIIRQASKQASRLPLIFFSNINIDNYNDNNDNNDNNNIDNDSDVNNCNIETEFSDVEYDNNDSSLKYNYDYEE